MHKGATKCLPDPDLHGTRRYGRLAARRPLHPGGVPTLGPNPLSSPAGQAPRSNAFSAYLTRPPGPRQSASRPIMVKLSGQDRKKQTTVHLRHGRRDVKAVAVGTRYLGVPRTTGKCRKMPLTRSRSTAYPRLDRARSPAGGPVLKSQALQNKAAPQEPDAAWQAGCRQVSALAILQRPVQLAPGHDSSPRPGFRGREDSCPARALPWPPRTQRNEAGQVWPGTAPMPAPAPVALWGAGGCGPRQSQAIPIEATLERDTRRSFFFASHFPPFVCFFLRPIERTASIPVG